MRHLHARLTLPAIGSVLAAGLVLGGIAMGWVADRIGRVRTLMLCVVLYSVFSSLTAFAGSATWVGILRFAASLDMGGALMPMGLPLGSMLAVGVVAAVTALSGPLEGGGWRTVYLLGFCRCWHSSRSPGARRSRCAAGIILLIPETKGIALQ